MKKIFRYLLLSCMFLMLVACGKPESQKAFEDKFKEFNSFVTEKMQGADEGTKKMAEIMSKATFKVNKVEEKGENSELNVTVKAVNLAKYVNEYIAAATAKFGTEKEPDEKEFNDFSIEYFTNVANDKNLEYVDTDVNVKMQKIDGKWEVVNADELVLGILGGAGNSLGL